MARYVDIDKPVYVRYIDERSGEVVTSEHTITEILSDTIGLFPVADAVEVVRCKDCKYVWKADGYDNLWCNRLTGTFEVDREGFCSWAKKI